MSDTRTNVTQMSEARSNDTDVVSQVRLDQKYPTDPQVHTLTDQIAAKKRALWNLKRKAKQFNT